MTIIKKEALTMLEKIKDVQEQSQIIGEFLDYMEQRDVVMCEPCNDTDSRHEACYLPTLKTTEGMLAFFFEIDLVKAEDERRALLESIRN